MQPLTILWLLLFLLAALFDSIITWLNIKHFSRNPLPAVFREAIEEKKYEKAVQYNAEKTRQGIIQSIFSDIAVLVFIFGGIFAWWVNAVEMFDVSNISSGLLFFGGIYVAVTIIGIPFSLYHTFVIEEKYGFNKQTWKLWLADIIKSVVLSVIIMAIILSVILYILYSIPYWFIFVWAALLLFSLIMIYIYPIFIAPLFNKFIPLQDKVLAEKIKKTMEKADLHISGVYQMDASKRSGHSNAYFTGLGKTKRIVLFDTLLKQQTHEEIIAILAHEAGHWKKKHIIKQLIISQSISLLLFYIAYKLINSAVIYEFIGIETGLLYAGLLILSILWSPVSYFISPLNYALSRHFEYEADEYSIRLTKNNKASISSLIKLYKENLANVNPHPLFVLFHHTHPDPISRIERILKAER